MSDLSHPQKSHSRCGTMKNGMKIGPEKHRDRGGDVAEADHGKDRGLRENDAENRDEVARRLRGR